MRTMPIIGWFFCSTACWAPENHAQQQQNPSDDASSGPNPVSATTSSSSTISLPSIGHTAVEDFPPLSPSFTAWVAEDRFSLEGAEEYVHRGRYGVRIEVLQLRPRYNQMLIRCDGCDPDSSTESAVRGFLQLDKRIRTKRLDDSRNDPLVRVLGLRAQWANGNLPVSVPEETDRNSLCALIDHGFFLEGNSAIWSTGGGRLELRFEDEEWLMVNLTVPQDPIRGSCRTTG